MPACTCPLQRTASTVRVYRARNEPRLPLRIACSCCAVVRPPRDSCACGRRVRAALGDKSCRHACVASVLTMSSSCGVRSTRSHARRGEPGGRASCGAAAWTWQHASSRGQRQARLESQDSSSSSPTASIHTACTSGLGSHMPRKRTNESAAVSMACGSSPAAACGRSK